MPKSKKDNMPIQPQPRKRGVVNAEEGTATNIEEAKQARRGFPRHSTGSPNRVRNVRSS